MPDLLIRNIDPDLRKSIEERARANQRSLSEEAKLLIRAGLSAPKEERKLGTLLSQLIPPEYRSDDMVFELPDDFPVPPDFE